mgnify:CR=1 FL=1
MKELDPSSLEFLLQYDLINELIPKIGKQPRQILHQINEDKKSRLGIWSALLNKKSFARAMMQDGWDLLRDDGKPGFSQSGRSGRILTKYHRYTSLHGERPLVWFRHFYGAFPSYAELDEEFRLYHDLAEDKSRGLLFSFDKSGRELEVAKYNKDQVIVKTKYLKQFQAGTGLHVAIYFDSTRYSKIPFKDIPDSDLELSKNEPYLRWTRNVFNIDDKKEFFSISRLLGKVIIPPESKHNSGIWPYDEISIESDVAFIAGYDSKGNEKVLTSNPNKLDVSQYLIPVFFRKEVLSKYYNEPERYKVNDGSLSCLGLWYCKIDNNLSDKVSVYLGDLGRDLPYEERLHWRQFNLPPDGPISLTNFKRSFLAQWTSAEAPDLLFRQEYTRMNIDWEEKYGWPLFLKPTPHDEYILNVIRIPLTNSQAELDSLIIGLTKLIVDSLNEETLSSLAGPFESDTKGITKLKEYLTQKKFQHTDAAIQFLRNLQLLRSTGSAHRKGTNYQKTIKKLGLDSTDGEETIRLLLGSALSFLHNLREYFLD